MEGVKLAGGGHFSKFSQSGGVLIKWPTRKITIILKEVEELMIPPDAVTQKLDGMVDNVPPDKGCEVLDRKLSHE